MTAADTATTARIRDALREAGGSTARRVERALDRALRKRASERARMGEHADDLGGEG